MESNGEKSGARGGPDYGRHRKATTNKQRKSGGHSEWWKGQVSGWTSTRGSEAMRLREASATQKAAAGRAGDSPHDNSNRAGT